MHRLMPALHSLGNPVRAALHLFSRLKRAAVFLTHPGPLPTLAALWRPAGEFTCSR